jgi:hypothetical protein
MFPVGTVAKLLELVAHGSQVVVQPDPGLLRVEMVLEGGGIKADPPIEFRLQLEELLQHDWLLAQ